MTHLSRLRILQELMFSHKQYRWNITSMSFLLSFSWDLCWGYFFNQRRCFAHTVIVPRLQRYRYWLAILQAMAVDSFLIRRKGDPAVLLFPSRTSRISLLGLTIGSVRFSLYLLLVSCVYRSNAHGSLPTDVPPALIQTTVT